jgi:hypothetical protein
MHKTVIGLMILLGLFPIPMGQESKQELRRLFPGTILGRVLDADGNPVADAMITPLRDPPRSGPVPTTYTDSDGKFVLEYVKLETYVIDASKMDEGYLYTCGLLLDCSSPGTCPKVTLTTERRRAEVTVRFGPKGGFVVGSVRDAKTNKPVVDAVITFYGKSKVGPPSFVEVRSDGKGAFISEALPLCPIRMKAEAPGYRTWYFNNAVSAKTAADLVVESGLSKQVDIWLVPE